MKEVLLALSKWKFRVGFEPTISFNPPVKQKEKQTKMTKRKSTNNITLDYPFTRLRIERGVNVTLPEWNSGLD